MSDLFNDMMENSTVDSIELSNTIKVSSAKIAEYKVRIQNILTTKSERVQELEQLKSGHSREVQRLQSQVRDIETQIQTLVTNFNTECERLQTKIAEDQSELVHVRKEIEAESFKITEASATLSMEGSRRDRIVDFTKKREENIASARSRGTVQPLPFINGGELPCDIRKIGDILIMDLNTVNQFLIGYNRSLRGTGLQRKIRLAITVGFDSEFAKHEL